MVNRKEFYIRFPASPRTHAMWCTATIMFNNLSSQLIIGHLENAAFAFFTDRVESVNVACVSMKEFFCEWFRFVTLRTFLDGRSFLASVPLSSAYPYMPRIVIYTHTDLAPMTVATSVVGTQRKLIYWLFNPTLSANLHTRRRRS